MESQDTAEFEVAVGQVVDVPVNLTLNDGANKTPRVFKFNLVCNRLDQDQINKRLEACENNMVRFMTSDLDAAGLGGPLVTGWSGQRLVIDKASGQPAEFSQGALAAMMRVAGIGSVSFTAYMTEVGAKQKN